MFDEGSAINLIELETANQLGPNGSEHLLTLQWYSNQKNTEASKKVRLEISGISNSVQFNIKGVQRVKNLDLPTQSFYKILLQNLPVPNYVTAKTVILIGLDNLHLGLSKTVCDLDQSRPLAIKTKLGWLVYCPNN